MSPSFPLKRFRGSSTLPKSKRISDLRLLDAWKNVNITLSEMAVKNVGFVMVKSEKIHLQQIQGHETPRSHGGVWFR